LRGPRAKCAPDKQAGACGPRQVPLQWPLPTALAVAAWLADTPPTCSNANCRHDASSARNWLNVFPLTGSAITLGVVGKMEHALTQVSEASKASLEYFMSF